MTEHRRYPRIPLHETVPLTFSFVDVPTSGTSHRVLNGRLADLSIKGCQVQSEVSIQKGDHIFLRVYSAHCDVPVSVEMATVRWTAGSRFGLEFISLWPADEMALREVIHSTSTQHPAS